MGENDRKCLAQSTINFPECFLKMSWENITHSWDRLSISELCPAPQRRQMLSIWEHVCIRTVEAPSRDNHSEYSPDPGVPSKGKMAEVHHGPVTGNTWTLSRLHNEVVSDLNSQSITLSITSFLNPPGLAEYARTSHTGVRGCFHPFRPVVQ